MSTPPPPMRDRVAAYVTTLQDHIVSALEHLDPAAPPFLRDAWQRPEGGHGISCVFQVPYPTDPAAPPPTTLLEKAAVNVSVIHGALPPAAIKQMRADHASVPYDPDSTASLPFFAAGISLIIHPRSAHAPTVHANYRYFEITDKPTTGTTTASAADADAPAKVLAWWFGGGSDLTPSYLYDADAAHFHATLKSACDAHGAALYPAFKRWCDEYFYLPHRGETRGLGGLFFDDLTDAPHKRLPDTTAAARPFSQEAIFAFVRSAGDALVPSYLPLLERRARAPTSAHERRWQLLRRGRYVEFNLVYDRGTKFGLMTPGARIESILVSLPEVARWEYRTEVGELEGSEEARLMGVLKKPKEWAYTRADAYVL